MVTAPALHPETTAFSLMLAVIASSDAPLILIDGGLRVIAVSASFCRQFQIEPARFAINLLRVPYPSRETCR